LLTFIRLFFSSRVALVAENLFLRKQLALFQERKTTRHRTTASFRLAMVALAKFFNWRNALMIVKPETFVGWHRTGFKMFYLAPYTKQRIWCKRPLCVLGVALTASRTSRGVLFGPGCTGSPLTPA
jgi:hypothetical protein